MDHDTLSDDALVDLARAGDAEAFGVIYKRYHDWLYRLVRSRLAAEREFEELAADLAHDVWLKAWGNLPTTSGPMRVAAWLTTIAQRLCIDYHRRQHVIRFCPWNLRDDEGIADEADITLPVERAETVLAVRRTLRHLRPNRQRALLARADGVPVKEMAGALGRQVGAVKSLTSRARDDFRRIWALHEVAV